MAWFDKRISKEDIDKMDAQISRGYGKKIKVVREKDLPIEDDNYLSIVNEENQILDDLKREAVDRDEKSEYESIEPEKE